MKVKYCPANGSIVVRWNFNSCSDFFVTRLGIEQLMCRCLGGGKKINITAIVELVSIVADAGFLLS